MGRGAYEPGLAAGAASPYHHLKQYVFSRTLAPVDEPQLEIVDTDPVELVRKLKAQEGLDIWLCGGGNLAGQLVGEIDRLIFKSYPVLAGDGIPALSGNFAPTQFTVTRRREFSNGAQVSGSTAPDSGAPLRTPKGNPMRKQHSTYPTRIDRQRPAVRTVPPPHDHTRSRVATTRPAGGGR